jgi:DNA repair protein RecO (recombination protein O)
MASYNTYGIVIGRHNFGEADRVMVLLTPDRGVIRAVAKGVRRIKSRLAGHLELFCESELMLTEGRNLDVLTSARLQHHLNVGNDYDKMRLAYLVAEMTNRLGSDGEHPGLFELVHETYEGLGQSVDAVLELWFKLRLLDRLGYRPALGACMICGQSGEDQAYYFNVDLGGIVDAGCASAASQPMGREQIKFWRLILSQPLGLIRRVERAEELARVGMPLCNLFYDHLFGQRFRSAEVLG